MISISAKNARNKFSQLLDKVEQGEEILISRHGKIIAHIIHHQETKNFKRLPDLTEFRSKQKIKGKPMSQMVIEERNKER